MKELRMCPFCGGKAVTNFRITSFGGNSDTVSFTVKCSERNCGIGKSIKIKINNDCDFDAVTDAMDAVIELWNMRALPSTRTESPKEKWF